MNRIVAILSVVFFTSFIQAQTPEGFTWQEIHNVNFGDDANHFTIKAASSGLGGEVELRLGAADGPVIGRAYFHQTGDPGYFLPYECELTQTISGTHDVYMNFLDYSEPETGDVLKTGDFFFSCIEEPSLAAGDSLHVYPPVPGLDPSPYYDIYIQKVNELNSSNLADATNWETPFAWFTQCPDFISGGDHKGYYSVYIGGWSNTYTNFELAPNTPIVIKIVRKDDTGDDAPSGPISSAMVRPAHRVDSWEIIDGDIYVTMSNPALVAVDIDGQLETRVAPRATPTGWNEAAFPYRSKEEGAHTVTVFANPFIEDKPQPDDPGVLVVNAGEKIPSTQELANMDWDILYFEPGIHRASVDVDSEGNLVERRWQADDPITLQDNKSYYVPGDAIVYGNFTDINRSNNQSVNIRIYGHGTVSGSKINHNKVEGEAYSNEGWWNRALYLRGAKNCHFEGITAVDPAFHTLCIVSSVKQTYEPNTVKWAKVLAWRTNSDGTALGGNVEMEDCFIRCQDDGHYIGGTTSMKRVVFWHDVNGQTFRGDFSNRRYSQDNAPNIPERIIYDDIDLIYMRGVFTTADKGYGIIGVGSGRGSDNETLSGGVENTGQMFLFRNIRMTDPNPTRNLFSFGSEVKVGDYAGFRFENIDYQGTQVFGWRNQLVGNPNSDIRNFVFDDVTISGEKMDHEMIDDHFITDTLYNMTFRKTYPISSINKTLTTTATNGDITVDTAGFEEVTVTALPIKGYEFSHWRGDLTGTESTATITMDSDKSITAIFRIKKFSITIMPVSNGAVILDPEADSYDYGTEVNIIFVPDLGYGLDSWGGDLSGSEDTLTITMISDLNISATVKTVPTYTLDVDAKYGSVALDPAGGIYNTGTVVTLAADPDPYYYFEQWLGDAEGFENPIEVFMDDNKTVNARFVYSGYSTVSDAINFGGPDYEDSNGIVYTGNTEGSNHSTSADIDGTDDDFLYQSERWGDFSVDIPANNGNYQVVLMFAEIYFTGSGQRIFNVSVQGEQVISNLDVFAKVGANTAYDEIHEVNVVDGNINIVFESVINNAKISAIKVVSDEFEGESFSLTINNSPNGVIETDPANGPYPAGANVQVTAIPDDGYKLDQWTGDVAGTENPQTLYMDADKNVSALFVAKQYYTLTTNATNGTIALDNDADEYLEGTTVTLTSTPDYGYYFDGWSGDLNGTDNPATITVDSNMTITAIFTELPKYTLTVNAVNGSVTLDPEGGTYYEGTVVNLTAIPDSGYQFAIWTGDLSGNETSASITMNEDKSVSAGFVELPKYYITNDAVNGTIVLDPDGGLYYQGTEVSLQAIPDNGYEFSNWSGDLSGTSSEETIIVNSHLSVSAIFSSTTDIDDIVSDNSSIQIYPNPVSDMLYFDFPEKDKKYEVRIYNLLGKIVFIDKDYRSTHPIDFRQMNVNGIVTILVISDTINKTFKVIVK